MNVFTQVFSPMHVLLVEKCSHKMAILKCMNVFTQVFSPMYVLLVVRCSHVRLALGFMNICTHARDLVYPWKDVHTIVPPRLIELIHIRVTRPVV